MRNDIANNELSRTARLAGGASAFKLLERKRRFKPQTIEIAKRRILRREPATALAAEYGVNLQRIYTRTLLNPI